MINVSRLEKFPTGVSLVTTGVLFPVEKILVTGHENGLVVLWDLSSGKYRILYACSSEIRTITCSSKKEILVGSHGGHIVILQLDGSFTVVQTPTYSVHSRVWKSLWLHNDAFVTSSTYGELNLFERDSYGHWSSKKLYGHSDSIFGMGLSKEGLLATGDYFGNILIWSNKSGEYKIIQRIKVQGSIEDIAWFGDDTFAVINREGRIYLFEQTKGKEYEWNLVFDVRNARGTGNCIDISEDGKTVFGGTFTETIQFDTHTQMVGRININGVRKIFCIGNDVFVLTHYGLDRFERKDIEVSPELIKYKYIKIGLVGHTGVGKSTLCSFITTGSPGNAKSTLGKKLWNWELPRDDELEKRIILQDHGGQETVLGTFLPFLVDSDMILILFQQNDLTTFNKALAIYNLLQPKIANNVSVFLVQTHIDQKIAEINERLIDDMVKSRKIVDNLKVCPKDGSGVEELKRKLIKQISWANARTMVQSTHSSGVFNTILSLQEENATAVSLSEFAARYQKITGSRIAKSHLKFLLNDYSNQGIVEYNPEVLDLIIFNEPEYNKLKTEIPIFAMKKNGIVSVEELNQEFKNSRFLPVIDAMYLKYKIAIENFGRRIFPELLNEKPIVMPQPVLNLLMNAPKETKCLSNQNIDVTNLLAALSDLKLQCIEVSKYDGLFSWEDNAVIYYSFERIGNVLDGFLIRCNYRIGGKNDKIQQRLRQEFLNLLEKFYGPFIEEQVQSDKKKVEASREIIYDVAISYASEQFEYAKKIADVLQAKGIAVFFDKFYEEKIWGRDLSEYLMNVYYKQSLYCIMLISRDYASKAWPTHERRSAIARNIEDMGEYILPVRFDDSEIPGLPPTIKYLDARKITPEEVAALFIKKLEGSKIPK